MSEGSRPKIITDRAVVAAFVTLTWLAPLASRAGQVGLPASKEVPCGVLEAVGGAVQLLDSSRTRLLDTVPGAAVPCGSWLSTEAGWAVLAYREGHRVRLGSKTFVEVLDGAAQSREPGDSLVLYKGEIHVESARDAGGFRVLSANGRARVREGSAIVVFSPVSEETQLIALGGSSSLENRFDPSRPITAKEGEATSLDFHSARLVPSTPRAVALSALKTKLEGLQLSDEEQRAALRAAKARNERTLAVVLPKGEVAREQGSRAPASERASDRVSESEKAAIQKKWAERLVGGKDGDTRLLSPGRGRSGRAPAAARVSVEDVVAKQERGRERAEAQEKARLMRALSEIRPE